MNGIDVEAGIPKQHQIYNNAYETGFNSEIQSALIDAQIKKDKEARAARTIGESTEVTPEWFLPQYRQQVLTDAVFIFSNINPQFIWQRLLLQVQ